MARQWGLRVLDTALAAVITSVAWQQPLQCGSVL